ncbi:hypothetical protein GON26_19715 [Flavobacterium sp. GA093]|uniref:Uncharacterized protein n=1 Tax=Flavobacterium hydrocarbonoxydans TaxID=2683249 RepID=A0A6I4NQD1_9FLAO|nr:hypothetical protein [Flavobacterium hydrocarbonoxydans]
MVIITVFCNRKTKFCKNSKSVSKKVTTSYMTSKIVQS